MFLFHQDSSQSNLIHHHINIYSIHIVTVHNVLLVLFYFRFKGRSSVLRKGAENKSILYVNRHDRVRSSPSPRENIISYFFSFAYTANKYAGELAWIN